MTPSLSIIVCTRNRWRTLQSALTDILIQIKKYGYEQQVEIVVVDNNSSDRTKQVVQSMQKKYPSIRVQYVHEPKIGVSLARNTGIKNGKEQWVVFIDDDTQLASLWMQTAMQLLTKNPSLDVIAGRILLPPGLRRNALIQQLQRFDSLWSLGVYDLGDTQCIVPVQYSLLLNNALIRKNVFDRFGYFDTTFGSGDGTNDVFGGEDVDLTRRILRAGAHAIYEPHLRAYHKILPHKLTWKYLSWRYYMNGKEVALSEKKNHHPQHSIVFLTLTLLYYAFMTNLLTPFQSVSSIRQRLRWFRLQHSFYEGYKTIVVPL